MKELLQDKAEKSADGRIVIFSLMNSMFSPKADLVYNVPDGFEEDPEVIRSELLFYTTPRSTAWSGHVYGAINNIQDSCYGDFKTFCPEFTDDDDQAYYDDVDDYTSKDDLSDEVVYTMSPFQSPEPLFFASDMMLKNIIQSLFLNRDSNDNVVMEKGEELENYTELEPMVEQRMEFAYVNQRRVTASARLSEGSKFINKLRGLYRTDITALGTSSRIRKAVRNILSERPQHLKEKREEKEAKHMETEVIHPIIPPHIVDPGHGEKEVKRIKTEVIHPIIPPHIVDPGRKLFDIIIPPHIVEPPKKGKKLKGSELDSEEELAEEEFKLDQLKTDPFSSVLLPPNLVTTQKKTKDISASVGKKFDRYLRDRPFNHEETWNEDHDRDFDRKFDYDRSRRWGGYDEESSDSSESSEEGWNWMPGVKAPHPPPHPPHGRLPPPPPPPRGRSGPDDFFPGALGFGASGDECMYQNWVNLTPPCASSVKRLHDMRAQYWHENEMIEQVDGGYHHGHFWFVILSALAMYLLCRIFRLKKQHRAQNKLLEAIHTDKTLKASVEASTGLIVPAPTACPAHRQGGSCFVRFLKAALLFSVVVFSSFVISITSLEITAHIVQGMDERRAQESDCNNEDGYCPLTSPFTALMILLVVCSFEIFIFTLLVRGAKFLLLRLSAANYQPSAPPSTNDSGVEDYNTRFIPRAQQRLQQWHAYAMQRLGRTNRSSSMYTPLMGDESSVHTNLAQTNFATAPLQQREMVTVQSTLLPSGQVVNSTGPYAVMTQDGQTTYARPMSTVSFV